VTGRPPAGGRIGTAAAAALIVATSLFPIYMMAVESLKTAREDVLGNPLLVTHPTLQWYLGLFAPVLWLRGGCGADAAACRWPASHVSSSNGSKSR